MDFADFSRLFSALKLKDRNRRPHGVPTKIPSLAEKIATGSSHTKLSASKTSNSDGLKIAELLGNFVLSPLHRAIRATHLLSQFVNALKLYPLTVKTAVAAMSEMFAFRGSILASFILVCLISASPLQVEAKAVIISNPIPTIKILHPASLIFLERLKSSMFGKISLSANFSFTSPQKTSKPPIQAVVENRTVQYSQDSFSADVITDKEFRFFQVLTAMPFLVLFLIFIITLWLHRNEI